MVVFQPFLLKTSNCFKIHKCDISNMRHVPVPAPYWGVIQTTRHALALVPLFGLHLIDPPSCRFQEFSLIFSLRFSLHLIIQMAHSRQNQYQNFREVSRKRRQLLKSFWTHTSLHKPLGWVIQTLVITRIGQISKISSYLYQPMFI